MTTHPVCLEEPGHRAAWRGWRSGRLVASEPAAGPPPPPPEVKQAGNLSGKLTNHRGKTGDISV